VVAAADADSLGLVNFEAMRLAIRDLAETYPEQYTKSQEYLRRIDAYEKRLPEIREGLRRGDEAAAKKAAEIVAFQREVLLANPLLDFDGLLLIKRVPIGDPRRAKGDGKGLGKFLGLPQQSSWQQDNMPNVDGWENEIAVMSNLRSEPKLRTLFKPPGTRLVGDLELHYDADKILCSVPNDKLAWQVCEIDADGGGFRQLSPEPYPDIHNYDACYLPNGEIAFISTAPLQGVPCNASVSTAMTYKMDADGKNVRQLCFDQDHNYCLTVTNDGRIMYLRWEYTDIPHVWGRYLFTMNPDGTCQREFYGSGGYWPNGIFYARAIPRHPTKVVGVVTGHHVGRVGELVIFDPALGRRAADGVVQRIPERGRKVEPLIQDRLTDESWPKFLHPYPLSEKHFLVSCKPTPHDLWGIYLVDVFDNMVLVNELEGYALLEPIPLRKSIKPPVIPDRIKPGARTALVYMENVYKGPGLKGVPRGSVKQLRLFTYHFAYQRLAGITHRVGADGPWEPKRVLGTVPVEEDGSAMFRVPAKVPISIQPLDADGKALQLMRSWTTAMPGEIVSCVGCHEKQNSTPPNRNTIAAKQEPSEIEPWRGPQRGFSFKREVRPVLDRHCVGCHDGTQQAGKTALPDLRADQGKFVVLKGGDPQPRVISGVPKEELHKRWGGVLEPSYFELRRWVRVGGLESDIRLLSAGEFGVETCELVQMLQKGHHGVELDQEDWDRLFVWIDLNAPCHGTWAETVGVERTKRDRPRRIELRRRYADIYGEDPEAYPPVDREPVEAIKPKPRPKAPVEIPEVAGWPFDRREARRRQAAAGPAASRTIDLGEGVTLQMVLIPAGEFVLGDPDGCHDERPLSVVKIAKPFWMGKFEVTNEQYAQFDRWHDSRYEHKGSWSFWEHHLGWPLNHPKQPVVRVSQQEAAAFCRWLSRKTGEKVTLPTEAQWEYACRAGSAAGLSYGDLDADFSKLANMADATIRQLAYDTDGRHTADLLPRDARFDDRALVTAEVGSYRPNAWGLHDMHGNVWEWTRTAYKAYPYGEGDGRNRLAAGDRSVARGGSWQDRPKRCRSAFRLSYPVWQKVHDVGLRVVCEVAQPEEKVALAEAEK
jgi:formylglycine-generating enzyme required for sulfatase activity